MTVKRVTQQKIDQAINDAVKLYKSGVNSLQAFKVGELSLPHLPTPIFKLELCTNMVSELIEGIQEVSLTFGKLEVVQFGTGYESTLTRQPTGFTTGTIYFKKSDLMIEEDIKIVSKQAEESLRAEVEAHNKALVQSEIDELREIEEQEQQELLAQQQAEQVKLDREKRKAELKSRLALAS